MLFRESSVWVEGLTQMAHKILGTLLESCCLMTLRRRYLVFNKDVIIIWQVCKPAPWFCRGAKDSLKINWYGHTNLTTSLIWWKEPCWFPLISGHKCWQLWCKHCGFRLWVLKIPGELQITLLWIFRRVVRCAIGNYDALVEQVKESYKSHSGRWFKVSWGKWLHSLALKLKAWWFGWLIWLLIGWKWSCIIQIVFSK